MLGEISGHLQQVFTKLSILHAKNNFSLALVTGNLFSDDDVAMKDLLEGKIVVPLPTYFTIGTSPLPQAIIEKIEKDEEVRKFDDELIELLLLIFNIDLP